jgi:hypothetical protein
MKILAIICNIFLVAFTGLILVSDDPPQEASYIVFTI